MGVAPSSGDYWVDPIRSLTDAPLCHQQRQVLELSFAKSLSLEYVLFEPGLVLAR